MIVVRGCRLGVLEQAIADVAIELCHRDLELERDAYLGELPKHCRQKGAEERLLVILGDLCIEVLQVLSLEIRKIKPTYVVRALGICHVEDDLVRTTRVVEEVPGQAVRDLAHLVVL